MTTEKKTAADAGLPEEEFAQMLQGISTMAPLLKGFFRQESPSLRENDEEAAEGQRSGCARREMLLLALKPYLSPARCEAVDYFIRLARVGDAIRALQ